jgi:hypothetical protein
LVGPAVVGGHVVAVILAVAYYWLLLFVSLLLGSLLKHAEHALKMLVHA